MGASPSFATPRPARGITVFLVGALFLGVALSGCLGEPLENDPAQRDAAKRPTSGSTAPPTSSGAEAVDIRDAKYSPAALTVKVGTTVTWTNRDPYQHTVTPTDKAQWGTDGSGDDAASWMKEGATWSFTFTEAGTYEYRCIPHSFQAKDGSWSGQTGTVTVTASGGGDAPAAGGDSHGNDPSDADAADRIFPSPVAPARAQPDPDGVVRITLEAREVTAPMADGATYHYWTFGGTVPGPMLRVREGDTVELTLENAGTSVLPHSIDLHAVTGPGGGAKATQTPPGESTSFRFKALNPGIYVYHCATPHIPSHVANGMYGLILVEPQEGLPPVDREFYVVQGELYTQGKLGAKGEQVFDMEKMMDEDPEYFVMNGAVGALAGEGALKANVGETVRIYFGVGGFVPSNFHVIGEIFDKVFPEGGFPAVNDVQTTFVPAGGATMVEFEVDVPGSYILVDHSLVRAIDRGAVGILEVTGAENPDVFRGGETPGSGH